MNTRANQTCQLLSAKELGKMLNLSKRQIFRLRSCGKIPAAVKIGGSIRWERGAIEKWIRMGCPDRNKFETLKDTVA